MSRLYPEKYEYIQAEITRMLGSSTAKSCTEKRSRERLLMVQKGLCHVLCEIFPQIDDPKKQELYYWLDAIHSITSCEEADSRMEAKA